MRAQHIVGFAFVGAFALVALGRADAPPGRYTIANGTVYDTKTRLTWELSVAASTFSWSDAGLYCGSIALGGAAWRVPTPKELSTLIDDSRYGPGIDLTAFPGNAGRELLDLDNCARFLCGCVVRIVRPRRSEQRAHVERVSSALRSLSARLSPGCFTPSG